jgi:hypothetical protein
VAKKLNDNVVELRLAVDRILRVVESNAYEKVKILKIEEIIRELYK